MAKDSRTVSRLVEAGLVAYTDDECFTLTRPGWAAAEIALRCVRSPRAFEFVVDARHEARGWIADNRARGTISTTDREMRREPPVHAPRREPIDSE